MKFTAFLIALLASAAALAQTTTAPITGIVTLTIPAPIAGPAGPQGPAGVSPTPAAVAAACTASPPCVAAIAAAVSSPVPPPPVVPPPPTLGASCNSTVVTAGKSTWTGNFNYGGAQEIDSATAPDGSVAMKILATTPMGSDGHAGGGGFQPFCQNPPNSLLVFDTTPFKFLVFTLMPTRAGQTWVSGFEGSGDVTIAGGGLTKPVESFGPAPLPNVWAIYKVPLGVGGYNLPAGTQALKFNLQDNMTWGSMPQNALGNFYYIKDIHFSTSALFSPHAANDPSWRTAA
jgi:hypothetical protein